MAKIIKTGLSSTKFLFLSLGVLIILILIYFGISFYVATRLVAPYPKKITTSPTLISSNYENVTMQGFENIRLRGWLFHAPSDKLVIIIHGITQNRVNNDYYSILIAKELVVKGYNVLLYDSRAHGESEGSQITYGLKENQDILNVVTFAETKGFTPHHIGIIADSLGALSLLLASDHLQDVGALVVDSPPTHLVPVINHVIQVENNIPALFNPGIYFLMQTIYHVDVATINPIAHIKNIPNRKFLFLHAELDQTIPFSQSQELLQNSNPESKLILFPQGSHVETYKSDPERYRDNVFSFLAQELQ